MCCYQRVPSAAVAYLYPCHIYLHQGAAAPLACLEQNHTQRTAGAPIAFENSGDASLGAVEHEGLEHSGGLVAYGDTACAPVLEVAATSRLDPCLGITLGGGCIHLAGNVCVAGAFVYGSGGRYYALALSAAAATGQGVEVLGL